MEESTANIFNHDELDVEFKRYLQILRPYISQLLDAEVIDICNSWIQKLTDTNVDKKTRNKYVFVLCYQIARGVLDEPFAQKPGDGPLPPLNQVPDSDTSTEVEYVIIDDNNIKNSHVLFKTQQVMYSDTDLVSQNQEYDDLNTTSSQENIQKVSEDQISAPTHKQTILCYTCPQLMKACQKEVNPKKKEDGTYEYRANNLIKRLREIKKENMLLHNELLELKEESKVKESFTSVQSRTHQSPPTSPTSLGFESPITVATTIPRKRTNSMNTKLLLNNMQELQENKNHLVSTVAALQEKLDSFFEKKRIEIEDIEARHKLDIVKIKSTLREEAKVMYDDKLDALKQHYEDMISKINADHAGEIEVLRRNYENQLREKDRYKNEIVSERDKLIEEKDAEISGLKSQLEELKNQVEALLIKIAEKPIDKPPVADADADSAKSKAQELEKRLLKLEKSKIKCAKFFEGKFLCMQREKHLTECSLQLQLVRQRAQVVHEVTEENQIDLKNALDKLENKYKDIVADVQTTAIQRRLKDQMALESILQAAFKPRPDMYSVNIHSPVNTKSTFKKEQNEQNCSYESEVSGLRQQVLDKSFGEDHNIIAGFCLDRDRFGELFEKIYIPQRDLGEGTAP